MDSKLRVVIVDDHEIFRDGLKFVLMQSKNIEVIAEATNGKEFLALLDQQLPDLVLMDIAMPVMDGIEATKRALEIHPNLKIIALSMFGDHEYYFKMVHAGVKGFVLKKTGKKELENAIREVMKGDSFFSNELLRNIIFNLTESKIQKSGVNNAVVLTKRENEILQLICKGLSNSEIADRLHISPKTVDGHRTNLLAKTESKNSINLVMYAIKHKLIDI